jgi:adenylate cyclase
MKAAGNWRTALPVTGPHKYCFSGFRLDPESGLMRDDGTEIQLRAKSLELLIFLVSRAGRVVTKDELLDVVWGGMAVSEDSLSQCIHDVRRALSDVAQNLIRTVPRRGYLFAGSAVVEGELPQPPAIATGVSASVAVLPFLNMSGDSSQDYFADGMVEESSLHSRA